LKCLGKHAEECESHVNEKRRSARLIRSTTEHVKLCGKQAGPSAKAKYYLVTDSVQYREGKVKRTP
jgi:hypothetical protein